MAISDISPAKGLKPQTKFFEELGETMINIDGCIAIMLASDTPQARAITAAFRKRLAEYRISMHGEKQEKIREEAFLDALSNLGFNISFTPLAGTMDE